MVPGIHHFNCDLPSTRRGIEDDPRAFFGGLAEDALVAIDEIDRLDDPGRVLSVAVQQYPDLRLMAASSSMPRDADTLPDALAGRMAELHLPPVSWQECVGTFGIEDLDRRLLGGGLPGPLLDPERDPGFFSEWIETFYARDVVALFNTRNRRGFLALFQELLGDSGGQLDFGRLAGISGQSRPTVNVHLESLRCLHAIHLVRPFHGEGNREIVSRPKCYAFDTGFVAFERGWRDSDRGRLWEHLVLDALRSRFPEEDILYWRDKSGRELDFVVRRETGAVDLVECEVVDPYALDPEPVALFRSRYAAGGNYIVTPVESGPYRIRHGSLTFTVCATSYLDSI